MSEQKPEVRQTSADIKKQIEQAKEDLKNSGRPLTQGIANEINATESTTKETTKADVKPDPEPQAAKGVGTSETTDKVDLKEWAKKKGIQWTTEDDVLSALYKSDQQFHEYRRNEKSKEQAQPPYVATPPPYQPPQYPQNGYPSYQPPPVNNRQFLENVAREYNMTVEDAERLMKFNRDFYEVASRADRERYQKELESIKQAEHKNSVFRQLSSDPTLRNPEIAVEFHRILEERQKSDPQSFEQDPNAYAKARDMALLNYARRNLEGQQLGEGVPPAPRLPTNPPRPLGQGNGGGSAENESGFDREAYFKLKTPQEKKSYLEKMGLVSTY